MSKNQDQSGVNLIFNIIKLFLLVSIFGALGSIFNGIELSDIIAIVLVVLGAIIVWVIFGSMAQARAEKAYEEALLELKQNPSNPDLREKALHLGREYSRLMKGVKNHRPLSESALMNDIHAATAMAIQKVEVTNPHTLSDQSVAEEIEKLGQLFLAGVLTADEFERGKGLFLGAQPDKAAAAVELLQNLDALKKSGVISEFEFNDKKWEILSERLMPGKLKAAK